MPWIESHSVLVRHRKLKEFARELKIKPVTAMGHLHALWHTAIEQAEDGDLSKWSEGAICDAAQWEGSEKEFLEAVLSSGFMDTGYLLHDWLDYAGRYLTSKYKTSNHERLVEIWAKFGKVYGKELKRNSLSVPKDSPPNLTEHNLTKPTLPTNTNGLSPWVIFKEPVLRLFGKPTSIATELKATRLVGELAALGATPEQLEERVAHYRLCWPDVSCTLQGIVNNWNQIPHLKPKREKSTTSHRDQKREKEYDENLTV